jgi:sugar/nucleoside kinase (ribokinase family)
LAVAGIKPVGVIGNTASDRIGGKTRPGGGPYHAGRALRALGRHGVILTKCADEDRRRLLTPLVCLGLPVLWHESETTAAFELTYDGENREMVVEEQGAEWTAGEMSGWVAKALAGVEWVQVAALRRGEFPPDALAELARGRRILLDGQGLVRAPGTGPLHTDAAYDPAVLENVSVLKLSEQEASVLGALDEDGARALGVAEVVITRGSRGVLVLERGRLEEVPVRPVEPVADPTGAGDAFAAVYLASRAAGNRPVGAARRAAALVADLLSVKAR